MRKTVLILGKVSRILLVGISAMLFHHSFSLSLSNSEDQGNDDGQGNDELEKSSQETSVGNGIFSKIMQIL